MKFKHTISILAAMVFCWTALSPKAIGAQSPSAAPTFNLPNRALEIVLVYRYLEARSSDFAAEFDQSLDAGSVAANKNPLETELYARLWATRVLREEAAHRLAEIMVRNLAIVRDPTVNSNSAVRVARKIELEIFHALSGNYISSLPLVDDIGEALSHMEIDAAHSNIQDAHRELSNRVAALYSDEKRALLISGWGEGQIVREWRRLAKTTPIAKSLESAIQRYGKALYFSAIKTASEDIGLGRDRFSGPAALTAPAVVSGGGYAPSTGPKGNLTGREFPSKMWALTYDDGPAKQTSEILDALAKRGLKATFFWLSKNAPSYAGTAVARAKSEGHGLANHSATHAQLTKVSSSQLDKEILDSTKSLESLYGQQLGFFRLPYGAGRNDSTIRGRIEMAGLIHVFWNVDTLDWQDRNPTTVYQRTMKQVNQQGRGVILFHDIHSQTVIASARVMDDLKSSGSRIVTLQEAVSVLNGEIP